MNYGVYQVPNAPYGGLYDDSQGAPAYGRYGNTSGPEDDEAQSEALAESISDDIAAQVDVPDDSSGYDTGALALRLPAPAQILNQVSQSLGAMFGQVGAPVPPPLKTKVAAKVAAKLPAKVAAKKPAPRPAALRPGFQIPARPLVQPVVGPNASATRKPISSIKELSERVQWCQLASLTGAPVTLAIGATLLANTLTVTRTGWVFDWSTNNNNGNVLASALTYAQQPNTIFSPTPLSNWGPAAANPSPIDPLYVTMPATLNVLLTNTNTAAAEVITWQMSGIPNEAINRAMLDPDVVAFLAGRGLEIARAAQAGYGMI